ncbi:hypothetical protein Nepgr_009041 [Nepenthes gracilis]|uniref:Cyclin-like domain-containing protein n=1 Tax=Nepenthes gracilis TaxID=150966 RepID=A0AAD3XK21_NEPGR|nr:hypothetical protein Nepgr_009041 [Nepenthes gracilis]
MKRSSFCLRVTTVLSKPWLSYTASSSSSRAQNHSSMEFDLESPLTNFEDHDNNKTQYPPLFLLESDHMISQNYARSLRNMDVNISSRVETISFILQLAGGFDPFLPYLAVNYLDRFFSRQGMPQAKPWVVRLLATACVSLAAKMMKTEFSLQNAQCDEGFIFDSQTIERMELIMLEALKWRLRSITPFSFLDFFISLLKLKDPPSRQALKARAREIIFKAQNGKNPFPFKAQSVVVDLLMQIKNTNNMNLVSEIMEFKPSIVAASAVLSASHELFPTQCSCFRKAISTCSYVNKVIPPSLP